MSSESIIPPASAHPFVVHHDSEAPTPEQVSAAAASSPERFVLMSKNALNLERREVSNKAMLQEMSAASPEPLPEAEHSSQRFPLQFTKMLCVIDQYFTLQRMLDVLCEQGLLPERLPECETRPSDSSEDTCTFTLQEYVGPMTMPLMLSQDLGSTSGIAFTRHVYNRGMHLFTMRDAPQQDDSEPYRINIHPLTIYGRLRFSIDIGHVERRDNDPLWATVYRRVAPHHHVMGVLRILQCQRMIYVDLHHRRRGAFLVEYEHDRWVDQCVRDLYEDYKHHGLSKVTADADTFNEFLQACDRGDESALESWRDGAVVAEMDMLKQLMQLRIKRYSFVGIMPLLEILFKYQNDTYNSQPDLQLDDLAAPPKRVEGDSDRPQ